MNNENQLKNQLGILRKGFQTIAQTANDAIIIAGHEGKIIFFNKKAQEIFQYTEEEMIGRDLTIIMPDKYKKAHKKGLKRFLATGQEKLIGHITEFQGIKQDGTEFPIELSLSFWKEEGKYFFSGIIRDISERKKANQEIELLQNITEAISATKDFYSALKITIEKVCKATGWDFGEAWVPANETGSLIKYAPAWYYSDEKLREYAEESNKLSLNAGQGIAGRVYMNNTEWTPDISSNKSKYFPRAELAKKVGLKASFGVPIVAGDKVLAATIFYLFDTRQQDEHVIRLVSSVARQLGSVIQRKMAEEALHKAHEELEKRVRERTAELSSTNLKLENEINRRKKVEESLRVNNSELKKSNADLDNFVYITSHDLKVPLINMEALLSILKEEMKNQPLEVNEVTNKFEKSLTLMKHTLNDISEVAKIQKNIPQEAEDVVLEDILKEVTESIGDVIIQEKAKIISDFSACPAIKYPRINMKSMLYNFLTNGIKYRSPVREPVIKIYTQMEENHPVLSVEDNGLGLDLEKYREKLFGMFRRFHSHVEGSGIGLYIVKRIVENNGGRIEVESELGNGTIFKVIF